MIGGNARIRRNCTTNDIQVNIGMRIRVIPGARMLMIVVMKLNAAASDETPSTCRPATQKSMFIFSSLDPGATPEYAGVLSGAYPNQPPSGAAWKRIGSVIRMPPNRYTQYEKALSRGKATSRAPICSGIRKLKNAAESGMTARNTIVVPCIVKSWLYVSAETNPMFGRASCVRIITASSPPIRKNASAVQR